MAIKDSIKEHLFGPDIVSTDENECSATDSELSRGQSAESLDDGKILVLAGVCLHLYQ